MPQLKKNMKNIMRILSLTVALTLGLTNLLAAQTVDFGDDSGQWSNDGECDDPRFEGLGMTQTPLLQADLMRDATDCSIGFQDDRLQLVGVDQKGRINFGDDSSEWSSYGACDDMRFSGPGMTLTPLLSEDIMTDATDCKSAFDAGLLTLAGQ